jgi:hypothetical protein
LAKLLRAKGNTTIGEEQSHEDKIQKIGEVVTPVNGRRRDSWKKNVVPEVEIEKGVEVSSWNESEMSMKKRKSEKNGGKRKKKKSKEVDPQFAGHINEQLIRYCKFYSQTRDSNPNSNMAKFVRERYYSDMYENSKDDAVFIDWWTRKQCCLKERIKVKRANMMSAVQRLFKGKWKKPS